MLDKYYLHLINKGKIKEIFILPVFDRGIREFGLCLTTHPYEIIGREESLKKAKETAFCFGLKVIK